MSLVCSTSDMEVIVPLRYLTEDRDDDGIFKVFDMTNDGDCTFKVFDSRQGRVTVLKKRSTQDR